MSVTKEQVLEALRSVQDPDLHKDIVALDFVKDVKIDGGQVDFTIELTTPACPVREEMKAGPAACSPVMGAAGPAVRIRRRKASLMRGRRVKGLA